MKNGFFETEIKWTPWGGGGGGGEADIEELWFPVDPEFPAFQGKRPGRELSDQVKRR